MCGHRGNAISHQNQRRQVREVGNKHDFSQLADHTYAIAYLYICVAMVAEQRAPPELERETPLLRFLHHHDVTDIHLLDGQGDETNRDVLADLDEHDLFTKGTCRKPAIVLADGRCP